MLESKRAHHCYRHPSRYAASGLRVQRRTFSAARNKQRAAEQQQQTKIDSVLGFRGGQLAICHIVGLVCENAEILGRGRELAVGDGNLMAMLSTGAYAACMSSSHISRPRTVEVMMDGGKAHPVRERQRSEALFALEHLLR
ncbi:MAG: hypothetical protein JJE42_00120 [Burkholderiales bacterium]|nr:hypothetical protein [Burkholderiales bacterium]